jgi:tRNA-specific 2-thiouridylase
MRVMVAMSGGVDSSVAAALLCEQGHDVVGVHMRVWGEDGAEEARANEVRHREQQLASAVAIAREYDFPLRQIDLREEFQRCVVDGFVEQYRQGRTPNPCVQCNRTIKFGRLLEYADVFDCAMVATGHYTRLGAYPPSGRLALRRDPANDRDQTYFLNRLTQEQLGRFKSVLSGLLKTEVRTLAALRGLTVADKAESREICFLPDDDYRTFLAARGAEAADSFREGDIVDVAGHVLGRHTGIANFTIGQRKGLGIAHSAPLYVLAIDAVRHRVVVGEKEQTFARTLTASSVNWMGAPPDSSMLSESPKRVAAQIRYRRRPAPALLFPLSGDRLEVYFDEPQPAIAPGQAVAFYDIAGEWLLAGAWIESSGD